MIYHIGTATRTSELIGNLRSLSYLKSNLRSQRETIGSSGKIMAVKELEGPFEHHVFIGYSLANMNTVKMLRGRLEKDGLSCFLRGEVESDVKKSIKCGVMRSQKCMIFLTLDYIKDFWFNIETKEMKNKAARFCRDNLLILKADKTIETPEQLKEYKELLFQPDKMDDEKYIAHLVDEVTREPSVRLSLLPKENIGYGAACDYFYGFLNLILPNFKERLVNDTFKNEPGELSKCVKKMLIIMPESCFCPPSLKMNDEYRERKIEFTGKYVVRVAHRAGYRRDYKSPVLKLVDSQKKKEYYFVGELATPLLTMYEMYCNGLCGMTKEQLYMERDVFYFTLKSILSHPDNASCNNQFKILFWPDRHTEKTNQMDLYDFLLPVLEKELDLERENEIYAKNYPKPVWSRTSQHDTFNPVEFHGSNPARIYETLSSYPMNSIPRGKCLIVNIMNFDKGHVHLKQRKGSEKDAEMLMKLFKELHFEAEVYTDVDLKALESLLLTMNICDHSKYDAFVCCILTQGKLGVIYASDGKPIEILEIADFFSDKKCESLKGKPKLFFVQACQRGDDAENNGSQAGLVPGAPDFLMSYATLPGSITYRDTMTGSLYIQALVDRLSQAHSLGQEIDHALKLVSRDVKEKLSEREKQDSIQKRFQLPFHLTSGMDRTIYL